MSPEKSEELRLIFPELFSDKPHLYIECNDGWYDLLKECIKEIKIICERDNIENVRVNQIKEKFGSLRFYLSQETDEMSDVIRIAERKSSLICEQCGSSGKIIKVNGWFTSSCGSCNKSVACESYNH